MTTPAQVAANQRNAQQSTGPKTTAGKARTSKNATTHGVLAEDVILTGENAQLFEERRDAIFADLSPSGELEQVLVERIVVCEWRLRRLRQIETSVFQYEVFDHEVRRAYDLAEQCTRPDYGDLSLMDRIVTDEKRRATALHQAEKAKAARENETLAIAFTKATTTTDTLTKLPATRWPSNAACIGRSTSCNGSRPPDRAVTSRRRPFSM